MASTVTGAQLASPNIYLIGRRLNQVKAEIKSPLFFGETRTDIHLVFQNLTMFFFFRNAERGMDALR